MSKNNNSAFISLSCTKISVGPEISGSKDTPPKVPTRKSQRIQSQTDVSDKSTSSGTSTNAQEGETGQGSNSSDSKAESDEADPTDGNASATELAPNATRDTPEMIANTEDANFKSPHTYASKGRAKKTSPNPKETDISDNSSIPSPSHDEIKPESLNDNPDLDSDAQHFSVGNISAYDNILKKERVNVYAPDTGPQMYLAKGNLVTRPIITKNLPKVFQYLPVHGKPGPNTTLQEFYDSKIREYVGCCINDDEFKDLETYCSPDLLKTGKEIKMQTNVPVMGLLNTAMTQNNYEKSEVENNDAPNLVILKKNKAKAKEVKEHFIKKLKYRGVRILPCSQEEHGDSEQSASSPSMEDDVELEPGVDVLYRVRIYRPYTYSTAKDRYTRSRHSVFCCDVVLAGRQALSALRDRFVCHNDFDLRVDVSEHPDMLPPAKAKEVFPSGFLFINNVFYVDSREGCADHSAALREWARARGLGHFPARDMARVRLHDLVLKLGYPEVYIHQGNCEHVFVFSEVRLLNANDPLRLRLYPHSSAISQNQTVYCTTCAEFSAKWIVVGSERVPFDPGFFCDTCFKQYMYKDGRKIGNFKAYRYRGNALNLLKPI